MASITALGGIRTVQADWLSGPLELRVETKLGFLNHSQDAGVAGQSRIVWDGNKDGNNTTIEPAGLSVNGMGIDLTKDGGTAFEIEIERLDPHPISLTFLVYDAASPSGKRVSFRTENLVGPLTKFKLTVPFSSFQKDPFSLAPASFANVGAIQLLLDGQAPDTDLAVSKLRTNGLCTHVPVNGFILDECGVCNGDNTSCSDCLNVPNGPAVPGTKCTTGKQGVCSEGTYQQDCSCVEDFGPTTELCDVVDNDCDGVIDNGAVPDKCGVCNGDGTSCEECHSYRIEELQFVLDGTAKKQEKIIKRAFRDLAAGAKISAKTQTLIDKILKRVHELQIRNWRISWTIPSVINECGNKPFCVESSNVALVDEYRAHSAELRDYTYQTASILKRHKLVRTSKQVAASGIKLYNKSLELAAQVPEKTQSCG